MHVYNNALWLAIFFFFERFSFFPFLGGVVRHHACLQQLSVVSDIVGVREREIERTLNLSLPPFLSIFLLT
jgi:hypothetical protein